MSTELKSRELFLKMPWFYRANNSIWATPIRETSAWCSTSSWVYTVKSAGQLTVIITKCLIFILYFCLYHLSTVEYSGSPPASYILPGGWLDWVSLLPLPQCDSLGELTLTTGGTGEDVTSPFNLNCFVLLSMSRIQNRAKNIRKSYRQNGTSREISILVRL